uniref:Uncharacterized protein n=1 Tax=Candidatus Kentrum sp. SD TaxID=2126332 RepID=A0A450Z6Q0_9GAMM|nr:MAG: hypothetical protein BECKSD772F_GA0070984_11673 [Candidatus Kentron sp. SD]VFK49449.1 MAG: hypothetical protein BECKSD772E_GA0070983_11803 [Candidatus Kentron sp. SD]VFK79168.1 MAG: hypothetical protein BECKSD772D_GA0070982_103815 [Candidatus Kentron sp. SD]
MPYPIRVLMYRKYMPYPLNNRHGRANGSDTVLSLLKILARLRQRAMNHNLALVKDH